MFQTANLGGVCGAFRLLSFSVAGDESPVALGQAGHNPLPPRVLPSRLRVVSGGAVRAVFFHPCLLVQVSAWGEGSFLGPTE